MNFLSSLFRKFSHSFLIVSGVKLIIRDFSIISCMKMYIGNGRSTYGSFLSKSIFMSFGGSKITGYVGNIS